MSTDYTCESMDIRLKQLQWELETLRPSVKLAREKLSAAERASSDSVYKRQWLQKKLLEADTAYEFDDLLDQLHKAEDRCRTLALERIVAGAEHASLDVAYRNIADEIAWIRRLYPV